jgi:hypothetical protein
MPETEQYATAQAPEEVNSAAAQHRLGNLISMREGPTRGQSARAAGGVAAVCLALLILLWLVTGGNTSSTGYGVLHGAIRALFIAGVASLGWTVRALLTSQRSWYLYTGGIVQKTGQSTLRAVAWPDATGLTTILRRRNGRNFIVGYRLAGRDGTSLTIPPRSSQDPFIDQVIATAREHNCPIT